MLSIKSLCPQYYTCILKFKCIVAVSWLAQHLDSNSNSVFHEMHHDDGDVDGGVVFLCVCVFFFFIHCVCACWVNKLEFVCVCALYTWHAINITLTKVLQINSLNKCTEYVIWLSFSGHENFRLTAAQVRLLGCWCSVVPKIYQIDPHSSNALRCYDSDLSIIEMPTDKKQAANLKHVFSKHDETWIFEPLMEDVLIWNLLDLKCLIIRSTMYAVQHGNNNSNVNIINILSFIFNAYFY